MKSWCKPTRTSALVPRQAEQSLVSLLVVHVLPWSKHTCVIQLWLSKWPSLLPSYACFTRDWWSDYKKLRCSCINSTRSKIAESAHKLTIPLEWKYRHSCDTTELFVFFLQVDILHMSVWSQLWLSFLSQINVTLIYCIMYYLLSRAITCSVIVLVVFAHNEPPTLQFAYVYVRLLMCLLWLPS